MTGRFPEDARGFTLVETMTALLLVATLVRIAVPNLQEMRLKGRAAEALDAIRTVEVAATEFHGANLRWPQGGGMGEVPGELRPFLPDGFAFEVDGYALAWEHWVLPRGLPRNPGRNRLLAVSVSSSEPLLLDAVVERVGDSRPHLVLEGRYVFFVEGE